MNTECTYEKVSRRKRLNPKQHNLKVSAPGAVNIYNKDGDEVPLKIRNKGNSRKYKFEENVSARQDSRRLYEKGFVRKLYQYKKRTSDETLLLMKDNDRDEVRSYTTSKNPNVSFPRPLLQVTPNNDSQTAPCIPSFFQLAQSSPSERLETPVTEAKTVKTNQICRICNVKFESKDDVATDSP